jgi:hypothetical protein
MLQTVFGRPPMVMNRALRFGGVNSDRVTIPNAASHQSLATLSMVAWHYPTTATAGYIIHKVEVASGGRWNFNRDSATSTRWKMGHVTNAVSANYQTDDFTLNEWQFFSATWDFNTPGYHIYRGKLNRPASEVSYVLQTAPTGSLIASTGNLMLGNNAVGLTSALVGVLPFVGLYNRVLTLEEVRAIQRGDLIWRGLVGLWRLGRNGLGLVIDESGTGNHGVLTGTVPTDGLPMAALSWPARDLWVASPPVNVYPLTDLAAGAWHNEGGAAAPLFASVDEPGTPNDADYIQSGAAAISDQVRLGFPALATGLPQPTVLTYRHRKA